MSSALMKLLADRKAQSNRVKTLKPNAGRNRYRILPTWRKIENAPAHLDQEEKEKWAAQFYADFAQHFIKDASGEIKAVIVCAEKTFGEPCSVCDSIEHGLAQHGLDDLTRNRLAEAKSGGRILFNVLHIDSPNPNEPQVLEVAPSVLVGMKGVGGLISLFEEWPDLIDPVKGADIIIEKSGVGRNDTRYGVQVAGGSKPVPPEALKRLHDLDVFVKQSSAEAERRALASISAISGVLAPSARPALAAPSDVPTPVTTVAPWVEEDPTAALATHVTAPAPVAAPAPAPVAAAPAPAAPVAAKPVAKSSLDDDLERMLAELND